MDLTNTKYSFTRPLILLVKIDINKDKFIRKTMSQSTMRFQSSIIKAFRENGYES